MLVTTEEKKKRVCQFLVFAWNVAFYFERELQLDLQVSENKCLRKIFATEDEAKLKLNSVALSPQANYTDRTATACRPS
jgi:hypothetical protein